MWTKRRDFFCSDAEQGLKLVVEPFCLLFVDESQNSNIPRLLEWCKNPSRLMR